MSRFHILSHPLTPDAPVWPGNPAAARTEPHESIAGGDDVNTTRIELFSHSGSHVDAPWHFNADGPRAADLPISSFVFDRPILLEIPKPEGGFITADDLEPHAVALASADLALVRTGWSSVRHEDPDRYVGEGPLLHPDGARRLMELAPSLRGVAIDAVSIGSPQHPDESVETHHVLSGTGDANGRFVLIYEDVLIDPELGGARRVYGWPLFIPGSDGSPVTLVAELDDATAQ
jgi:arylformamidase